MFWGRCQGINPPWPASCGPGGIGASAPRRYTLSQDQILKAAPAAVDAGVDAIVLQSGEYTLATTESR